MPIDAGVFTNAFQHLVAHGYPFALQYQAYPSIAKASSLRDNLKYLRSELGIVRNPVASDHLLTAATRRLARRCELSWVAIALNAVSLRLDGVVRTFPKGLSGRRRQHGIGNQPHKPGVFAL